MGAPFLTDPVLKKRLSTPQAACALNSNLELQIRVSRRTAGSSKLILELIPQQPLESTLFFQSCIGQEKHASKSQRPHFAKFVVGDCWVRRRRLFCAKGLANHVTPSRQLVAAQRTYLGLFKIAGGCFASCARMSSPPFSQDLCSAQPPIASRSRCASSALSHGRLADDKPSNRRQQTLRSDGVEIFGR